ncbi:hypothetical protein Goklo_014052 [Gossypium klotzschianum]|uniref:Uncharacterized protein n=1 Tax=Gossypium klotzschianum TaxID=34286 RepID=A0A7J8U6E3_9ROSI|nr:hypothetical protein [Gossypium klotzschianum]
MIMNELLKDTRALYIVIIFLQASVFYAKQSSNIIRVNRIIPADIWPL